METNETEQKALSDDSSLEELLNSGDIEQLKALFSFDKDDDDASVILRYNLWSRYFFPQYFETEDASFHVEINQGNLDAYRGRIDYFVDIAFRGAGKDVKTKLFIPFCILNDIDKSHRYYRILTEDGANSKQIVTDIYNMLVAPDISVMYPEVFQKTDFKREETMSSFTTATGIKVAADTVGTEQRGAIQEEIRPDFIWFNDFETRKTLRSATVTNSIKENMEEARTGLQKGGCCIYTANYISELGNVHVLVTEKLSPRKRVLIVPIMDDSGVPTWSRYTVQDIEQMRLVDEDFWGERMCKPDASKDVYFDREVLDKMEARKPIREIAGFKLYREYDPSHRYASGHDVAGGVGLDSSTSVFIDFDTIPAQVVGTYASNTILPEAFGDEVHNESDRFGGALAAIENNKFDQAVLKAKLLGTNLYRSGGNPLKAGHKPPLIYGWNTNGLTKSKMLAAFRKAITDGLIALNDPMLIKEAKNYTLNDVMDKEADARDTTRHYDLLIAACIAWQMKDFATVKMRQKSVPGQKKERDNVAL